MAKKRKKLSGIVMKIIKPVVAGDPEKAEIALDGGDDLYREIRTIAITTFRHNRSHTEPFQVRRFRFADFLICCGLPGSTAGS
jgi:hypothetical protein